MRDNPINALRETLRCGFAFRKSRLESLCVLVFGVFVARTVNLSHLACHFPGRARSSSKLSAPATVFRASRFRLRSPRRVPGRDDGAPGGAVAADHGPDQLAAGSPRRQHLDDRHRQPRHRHSRVLAGARQGGQFQYQGADRDPRTRPPALRGRQDRQPPGRPGIHRRRLAGMVAGKGHPLSHPHPIQHQDRQHAWSHGQGEGAVFATSNPGKAASSPTPRRLSEARKPKARPSSSPRSISRPANC